MTAEAVTTTYRWSRDRYDRAVLAGVFDEARVDWSEPEPDVWVARIIDATSREHPTPDVISLIVEVSWSSEHHDRVRKLPLYARAGVPEYWIVDLAARAVDVHVIPVGDRYLRVSTARPGDVLTVPGTDLTVDITSLLGG